MPFANAIKMEFNIPRGPDAKPRIHGFFQAIGWEVKDDRKNEFDTFVRPYAGAGVFPYYQTTNPDKLIDFEMNDSDTPSHFSRGLWHPKLQMLSEFSVILATDDEVRALFEAGGDLLAAHTHIPLREWVGAQEFRFADPYNNQIRVTVDDGSQPYWPEG